MKQIFLIIALILTTNVVKAQETMSQFLKNIGKNAEYQDAPFIINPNGIIENKNYNSVGYIKLFTRNIYEIGYNRYHQLGQIDIYNSGTKKHPHEIVRIYNTDRKKLGSVENGTILNEFGGTIGYINGNEIQDDHNNVIAHINGLNHNLGAALLFFPF